MASASSELVAGRLRLADEFLTFAAWLASTRTDGVAMGWAVTNVYYAALHTLSAYVLARHGASVETRQDRLRWFREYPELRRSELLDYRTLKWASEEARYQGQPYTETQYAEHRETAEKLCKHWRSMALR